MQRFYHQVLMLFFYCFRLKLWYHRKVEFFRSLFQTSIWARFNVGIRLFIERKMWNINMKNSGRRPFPNRRFLCWKSANIHGLRIAHVQWIISITAVRHVMRWRNTALPPVLWTGLTWRQPAIWSEIGTLASENTPAHSDNTFLPPFVQTV